MISETQTPVLDVESLICQVEADLAPAWADLESTCHRTFARVLDGFLENGLAEVHFASVTGYGHNDLGREVTDRIFAHALQAEAALVRLQIVSGTHAIFLALRACLRPGQTLLALTGAPYDTLEEVIGIRGESAMSLTGQGVMYQQIDLLAGGVLRTELTEAERAAIAGADVAFIQRSRGYSDARPTLFVPEIAALIAAVRQVNPDIRIVVDNCYGEFTDLQEPTAVGADLIAGSLIKNPGGGLVPTGGYVAGRSDLVEAAAEALTAPGIGSEGGYTFDATRTLLQGLYFAPTVVKEAMKGMGLFAAVFGKLGYDVAPAPDARRADIIQTIRLGDPEKVLAFCRTLQSVSPVDSRLTPIPDPTPGYADPVVMAGGTFISGSTIELSADAPMRPPYTLFVQGGLTYTHVRYAVGKIVAQLQ